MHTITMYVSFQLHPLRDFVHRFTISGSVTGLCVLDGVDDHESARTKKLEGTVIVVHLQLVNGVAAHGSGTIQCFFSLDSLAT